MSAITPEHWQKVKRIFQTALEYSASARAAFLDEACAGDAALRAEVEDLLAAHEDTSDFLAKPAAAAAVPTLFAETAELPAGQKLGGYEIQRKLGAGGMGEVYLARDSRLGRPVALKVLPANLTREPDRVKRFQQEARAASALNHPNILTVYEVGEDNGVHFIATEYIEGQTLRALLKRGELTLGAVLDLIIQVGEALEASHKAGIIHRDIKPENVMQRADGYVKVLDFGLAKLTERPADWASKELSHFTTRPGVVMGTVAYMSPEQARGQDVNARSDVFSLGVVLYEMLTGRVPFAGATTSDVIAALLEREPQPLDAYISGLPVAFQTIVERALQKRRENRYASVSEVLSDLRSLKAELEITTRLKRSGKASSAERSLLEMRVGRSTAENANRPSTAKATNQWQGFAWLRQAFQFPWLNKPVRTLLFSGLIYAAIVGGINLYRRVMPPNAAIDSIAVLPFTDNVNDAQLIYLPDGLTESLINNLSRLPRLRVMANGSVLPYKTRHVTPQQVGQELNVRAVVSGRIRKAGDKFLVNVEMADARDGARLWGEQYERSLADLVAMQNEIVRDITQQMRVRLSGEQEQQLARRQPANNEAYQHYLKGRFYLLQSTQASYEKALEQFQQAINADPTYALAYTGIADYYADASGQYLVPTEAMPKAKAAAMRALELDPTLAEAHHSLGFVQWLDDWNFVAAEASFKRALELNPNAASTMSTYADVLMQLRRFDEALALARRGVQLDPLSPGVSLSAARILRAQGRYDEAIAQCRKALELNPNFSWAICLIAQCRGAQGRYDEALVEIQRAINTNRHDFFLAVQGYILAKAGKPNEARQVLQNLEKEGQQRLVPPLYLARIYLGLNDNDRVISLLQQAYQEHSDHVLWVGHDQFFDAIRHDPRFIAFLKQVGLPQ